MKSNTQKFLTTYKSIHATENLEVIGKFERLDKEKTLAKLHSDLKKFGSKVTESEFEFLTDLCCDWNEFHDCYQNHL